MLLLWSRDCRFTPRLPRRGAVRGERHRPSRSFQIRSPPPLRKIADRFEQLHGLELSGASAWHATERAARAGRCEYERIRQQIQDADIVHIDETGIKRDGEQAWIWTFRTDENTLYAVRESRGSDVPAEVLGEDFRGNGRLRWLDGVSGVH